MRHINYYHTYYGQGNMVRIDKPYLWRGWTFANPQHKHGYVKILQCLIENPGLKRNELHEKVFGIKYVSGNRSCLYAVMLWADLIDYDKKFRYTITEKGKKLLKDAYLNDIAKMYKTTNSTISEIMSIK